MLVRWFWPDCAKHRERGADPVDAYWIEAGQDEAEAAVFPHLGSAAIETSHRLAQAFYGIAERMGTPARPFCFLVARDLTFVEPGPVHYPFHQLWNAYSPFEQLAERTISDLTELQNLTYPPEE